MARAFAREQGVRIRPADVGYRKETNPAEWTNVLEELGMVAVPVKPTMEQIVAATTAAGVTVDEAWRVYSAMLKAADMPIRE